MQAYEPNVLIQNARGLHSKLPSEHSSMSVKKQMDKQKFLKIPQKKRILFTLLHRTSLNFKPSFRNCKRRVYMYTCNCDISSFIYIYIPQFLHLN